MNQLTVKFEKLVFQKGSLNKNCENLHRSLDELNQLYEKTKYKLQDQFLQIQKIIEYKQQELELQLDHIYTKQKSLITEEIKSVEEQDSWIGNLMNMIDFATSYQNTEFVHGSQILLQI